MDYLAASLHLPCESPGVEGDVREYVILTSNIRQV